MTPTQESLSSILQLLEEEKKEKPKEGKALVEQFLSDLREAGVKISKGEGSRWNDHHYHLEHGGVGIEVSLHGFDLGANKGWWSVGVNYVNTVLKLGGHWGAVFITPEKRYWVDGCNFFRIAGDKTKKGRYHVQLAYLERSPSSANCFSSVREFLSITGLK